MSCNDCPYFWADCDDRGRPIGNAHCHYAHNDGYAPCEIDDDYDCEDDYE